MKLQLKVPDITCGDCVNNITNEVKTAAIKNVITSAGYQVS